MRSRISWLVVATTSVVVVSFVVPLCLLVRTLAEDRAVASADQEARNVAILVAGLHADPQLPALVASLDARSEPATTVLTTAGRVLGSGAERAAEVAADPEVVRALGGEAFTAVDDDGVRVLLPVVVDDGTAVVRTAVPPDEVLDGVRPAWAGIIGLGVLLMVVSLVVARRLARRISEPLRDVAGVAHRLREGDLAARADVAGTEETEELARALNGLAERTGELLAAERAAVGDLSHRLRTPVTALRLDAEAVPDPVLAQRLQEHIGTLQRTIDAIVREARRPVRTDLGAACDAAEVVRRRAEFWRALAEDQLRPTTVDVPDDGPLPVPVAEDDLADVVDVLVDNVFAHTPEGVGLSVSLRLRPARRGDLREDVPGGAAAGVVVVLQVRDRGPGFDGTPGGDRPGSTGLGLDIARRTAEGCGGTFRIGGAPGGGTLVELLLPLRAEA